jgi:protein-tyrosine phosphatase
MIDWHCHLLPGIDDGASSLDESIAMGRVLVEAGFSEIYCTPHCLYGAYDNTPAKVQEATRELQQAFCKAAIPLRLHPGMEYYLDEMFLRHLDNLQPLGQSRLVLVEAPQQAHPELLRDFMFQLLRRKWTPVLAHPERCALMNVAKGAEKTGRRGWLRNIWPFGRQLAASGGGERESLRESLYNMGCRFQGNISSLAGWYGRDVEGQAITNLNLGFYNYYGTDGHNARGLKRTISRGLQKIAEARQQASERHLAGNEVAKV